MPPRRLSQAQIDQRDAATKKRKEAAAARRAALVHARDAAAADGMPMADPSSARLQHGDRRGRLAPLVLSNLSACPYDALAPMGAGGASSSVAPPPLPPPTGLLDEALARLNASIASGIQAADQVLDAQGRDPLHVQEGPVPPLMLTPPAGNVVVMGTIAHQHPDNLSRPLGGECARAADAAWRHAFWNEHIMCRLRPIKRAPSAFFGAANILTVASKPRAPGAPAGFTYRRVGRARFLPPGGLGAG